MHCPHSQDTNCYKKLPSYHFLHLYAHYPLITIRIFIFFGQMTKIQYQLHIVDLELMLVLFFAGVWTDGRWVFSTGLDQRIRCWHLEERGKLTEHKHMVVSVPEPEALDARVCGRWVILSFMLDCWFSYLIFHFSLSANQPPPIFPLALK